MTCQCDQQHHSRGDNSTRLGYRTTCTSKLAVNSLPFSNLNDNDFNNTINLRFNLQDNFLTRLENFKFNPFSLDKGNDTHADQNIDLDNNDLFRQINEDNCQYYTEESFNDLILQNNDHSQFSLLHFNIRSIRNKHDDLCNYLDSLNMAFSITGLTETWFTDKCPPIYDIPTHNLITKNRKTKTGGVVGLYITKDITFKIRDDLSIFHEEIFESICIELQIDSKNKILISVIYRPPNNKINESSDVLEKPLVKINNENKKCYLMGDFNINVIKIGNNTTADAFVNQLLSSSFYPLITKPTRITERSATLIDNILANRLNNNNINGILFSDLSDHLPLFIIEQNIKVKSQNYTAKMKRNISKENIDKFVEKLEQIHWEELNQETDPSKAYDRFYSKLFAIYDNCIPMKKMSNKQRKLQKKPWLTKAIIKSLTIKDKLYKKNY